MSASDKTRMVSLRMPFVLHVQIARYQEMYRREWGITLTLTEAITKMLEVGSEQLQADIPARLWAHAPHNAEAGTLCRAVSRYVAAPGSRVECPDCRRLERLQRHLAQKPVPTDHRVTVHNR